ncbi:MAG: GAF domain-containing protein [Flavobacteriales bacterium]|nr:GAF domain-containing protein [Flavobacteriia bacterium]NCP05273.1 GAF domain-containing protein [Flavobacteriales bacterium]PIV95085.1 MAG: GAF domain-containing protein [Flavobacteriaceae bacterium CG17_big_fil_post_rev_8_21_14_2_50_33_15]PIY09309.1 MAG: GAF domain-containing protein [Flavobacteriaceae bacterium CG_4_10_14_3_um_filter_33_47]PJB20283.1 MAG: GAF domain-containing protein [Flavobacteriaceae bacterium CG_4_9_14_3_um_filter_33_16]
MNNNQHKELPILFKISFNKLLLEYEKLAEDSNELASKNAHKILKIGADYPELREGFTDLTLLETYKSQINAILYDSFNPLLTKNEIKAASIPFEDVIFNSSERFKKIIKTAGDDFVLRIENMPEEDLYIIVCVVILNFYYGYNLNFKRPFLYKIPDAHGIIRYFKILYNADFLEIFPTQNAPKITEDDYNQLLDNFHKITLWREKFPPKSYLFKGFVISNIFDVTEDQSISNVKSSLIKEKNYQDENQTESFQEIFRSLFGIKDLKVGFSVYNRTEDMFERVLLGNGLTSFLLNTRDTSKCHDVLCLGAYNKLLNNNKLLTFSDVDAAFKGSGSQVPELKAFKEQGIKSAILAPIASNNQLLGVLEIVSNKPKVLNSINAIKLTDIMPFIISAVKRTKEEEENLIEAIIQKECTSIHTSVHWKFVSEAKKFIHQQSRGEKATFNKIAFNDIYPLFGQIDIKGSSEARNLATRLDLNIQLNDVKLILQKALNIEALPVYEQFIYQINEYLEGLDHHFQVDSERQISNFLNHDLSLVIDHLSSKDSLKDLIHSYKQQNSNNIHTKYTHREKYDTTISLINKEMALFLDKKQAEAQKMYPHYFERFKTDGVEHNMYIGEAITKEDSFNPVYLYNLRLWQLQVMCEMENAYYKMQPNLPIQLDVASMILVFNQPLSISFRMDEKRFDVEGTYNARYENIKKRVDKAYIKGTKKRITQKGKIAIIYSQNQDEVEYLRYVKFLQSKKYLDTDISIVDLEDLQAVTGLKAMLISILYTQNLEDKEFYTYEDLMKELKS